MLSPHERFPSVSILIVCYNEINHLEACLTPLVSQEYPEDFEVVLIDNASTDGSADYVRRSFPSVRIVEPGENLGFAKGNNFGASEVRHDAIVFLNADTRVQGKRWLRALIQPLVDDPAVGLTTSKIVLMDQPDIINACGLNVSLTGIATCRHAGKQAASVTVDEEVASVSGGAFAIRSQLFRELGGFDHRIWIYHEDTDLSWRARLAGYRCVLAANSVVEHDYEFKLSPQKVRDIERTRYLMLAKNLRWRTLVALIPALFVSELFTWGWAALKGPTFLWAKAQAVYWTVRQVDDLTAAHIETQGLRRVPDFEVLRFLEPSPETSLVSAGVIASIASFVLSPLAVSAAIVALRLIATRGPEPATRS